MVGVSRLELASIGYEPITSTVNVSRPIFSMPTVMRICCQDVCASAFVSSNNARVRFTSEHAGNCSP